MAEKRRTKNSDKQDKKKFDKRDYLLCAKFVLEKELKVTESGHKRWCTVARVVPPEKSDPVA